MTAKYIHQVWQKEWDEDVIVSNKLHEILPKLSGRLLPFCKTRKKDKVVNRPHIGHSLIHSFLLRKKEKSLLVCVITVKHILIKCADLVEVRRKNYIEERFLYSLFRNVNPDNFFDNMKEIGMFHKV